MIECHTDLSFFFYEKIHEAVQMRNFCAPVETEHYLVTMLIGLDKSPISNSLVELEVQAQKQPNVTLYKSIGDNALSLVGLFEEHLTKKNITVNYVETVGSRAYKMASNIASVKDSRAAVFYDLSAHFPAYAQVLDDVKENTTLGTPNDVLSLYEKYTKTESPVLLSKLLSQGLIAHTTKSEA